MNTQNYSGNAWQGSKYEMAANWTTAQTAKAIKKDLQKAFPGFKFSVTSDNFAGGCSIDARIISGYVPQYLAVDSVDELTHAQQHEEIYINGWPCNYWHSVETGKETTEEEKQYFLNHIENPEFNEVVKKCKSIHSAYNYDNSDSMTDYFDVNYYGCCRVSNNYEHTPETAPKAKPTATAPTSSEVGNLDGIAYTAEEDTDTRTGEPLTVVKLAERVDRDEYKRIAEVMKGYGGYYSRFKGGFIFKTRPAFLDAEPVAADNTPGGESEELATVEAVQNVEELDEAADLDTESDTETEGGGVLPGYVDPATLNKGDMFILADLERDTTSTCIFEKFNPETKAIKCSVNPCTAVRVYHIGRRYQITKITFKEPQDEESTATPQYIDPATLDGGDRKTSEEQPQTGGEIIRRGRNIYHTGANAAKVVEDFGQIETGRKYTLIKFDEWGGYVGTTYFTVVDVSVRKYAQYENAVEITYKAPRKRHTDKKIMHEEQSYILYDGFVSAIPDSVLFNIEERPGVTTKMSKYSCCDIRNLIDIKRYYEAMGVLPLADTLPNLDDPQPPTDPTPSEPEELPTLSPAPSEPENSAEVENLDPVKGEGGDSELLEMCKKYNVEFLKEYANPSRRRYWFTDESGESPINDYSGTEAEAAEYAQRAANELGAAITMNEGENMVETFEPEETEAGEFQTSEEITATLDELTKDLESWAAECIGILGGITGETPEPPTDPQPTKPTQDSEPTEETSEEAPGEDMPTPSPASDPEPIGAGELPETEPETVPAVIVHELPKNLIEQANNNSQFNRGDGSARSYAAYCEAVQSWDISDSKKQKILDKVYKKYLPILQNQAAWVPWTVTGPARYNAKKLDKGDRVMQLSAEFSDWFNGIKNGIQSKETTGHDEKAKRIINNIKNCIADKGSEKIRLDWDGLCRKYLEELATLSQSEFVKWFEESNKAFKFRKSTNVYKLYNKAVSGGQITTEKKELFSDENLTAYSDGGRVYIRFFSRPAQQLKFALKKHGYWWNSYRSEWSTYESRYNAEWVQGISTQYEKYI